MAKEKKKEDLKQFTLDELGGKLVSARKSLFDLKIKRSELKNPLKLRWVRRDIARILTTMQEKKGQGQAGGKIGKAK